jgi:deoxyribodipyrimidine photolyase-related protein
MKALLLFPNQLYFDIPNKIDNNTKIYLVEEFLFFRQYKFHKQKLIFHRASMRKYALHLVKLGFEVEYFDAQNPLSNARTIISHLSRLGHNEIMLFHPEDNWLQKRLQDSAKVEGVQLHIFDNQLFINNLDELLIYKNLNKKLFQTDFYMYQRRKRNILLDEKGSPVGGKWSFDSDNRKKYPASKKPPALTKYVNCSFITEAQEYVQKHFENNPGSIIGEITYPICPVSSKEWLNEFFEKRFAEFGVYEDAIVDQEYVLNHSVLTPMLNVGILKPIYVIESAIEYAKEKQIELNNLEGFVRQILGWREFVRYVYHFHGTSQRTKNYWGFSRKIPASFYSATTGIKPIDQVIQKLLKSGYNHHIERLMVISNFMLLCEFDPNEVYRWFIELYIDAFDWVMVPNIYGMGQFADGGLMCSKPYISGSNYIFKMSNYKKGEEWADLWDALFWRFMSVHRDFFKSNPRLSMLINTFDKWDASKRNAYLQKAEIYLASLDTK